MMWKNMVGLDRPHMKICLEKMYFACWITRARIQIHTYNI